MQNYNTWKAAMKRAQIAAVAEITEPRKRILIKKRVQLAFIDAFPEYRKDFSDHQEMIAEDMKNP